MSDNITAVIYAIPDGIANWVGKRVSIYTKTPITKIIENAVQGIALATISVLLIPYGWVIAIAVLIVKIKNIISYATGTSR